MFFLLVPFLDAAEIIGKAVKIFDGDSFIVLDELDQAEFGIRIQGIDAPEHDQPFFAFAKKNLEDLLNGKKIRIRFREIDSYGRILGNVYLEDKNIALTLLERGCAWHYRYFSKDRDYAAAEAKAQKIKAGLWFDSNPTPPWSWRYSQKKLERERKSSPKNVPQKQPKDISAKSTVKKNQMNTAPKKTNVAPKNKTSK